MRKVSFKEWEFEVNFELTKNTYKNVVAGGSKTCTCFDCENFREQRVKVYPQEVRFLFEELGIDYKKDFEIYTFGKLHSDFYEYGGWFHFAGKILSGTRCRKNKYSSGIEFTRINEKFEICFSDFDFAPTFFNENSSLVEVIFGASLPWVIEESKRSE